MPSPGPPERGWGVGTRHGFSKVFLNCGLLLRLSQTSIPLPCLKNKREESLQVRQSLETLEVHFVPNQEFAS